MVDNQALRYNTGKIRYDLLEPYALEQLANVFTKGAEKYSDHNWLKGMDWSKMIASLKRHLASFEQGEDFDKETELLHIAHVAWNAMALTSYYKYAPQFDNRKHSYLKAKRIGLDVDEVCANWVEAWCTLWNLPIPDSWLFHRSIKDSFISLENQGKINEFMLNLKPLFDPKMLPFEPYCYITCRHVENAITEQWLDLNGFPASPVFTVKNRIDKIAIAKEQKLDFFIDDNYETFVDMNNNGICCLLMDAQHNRKYDVGYKRIKDFNDFKQRFL